ncbi:acyl-protein synthetase [Clostridium scatologenes]|uniref:Acyl-protein synthetase, LuxE n=1 Tax=Clostridium scatologenes TaxID=1548 RepID=A0A0E3GRQ9_CLOSL|nr:acyl-protein synthetase [Clostridium scatologenes]AKA70751.1 acyl-protein synthetase, LuxE [Clostridium scatologenes]
MINKGIIDSIVLANQFKIPQNEKEEKLLKIIKEQLKNFSINSNLRAMYKKSGIDISKIFKLEEVPFIPVNMFKEFDLSICSKEDVIRILNSSATTTGKPSKIYLDKTTSLHQTQGLISTLVSFLGTKRRPMLIIDDKNINGQSGVLTARGAAIRGVSSFASKITYVMEKCDDNLKLNMDKLKEFERTYKDREILVYGFTYIIWSKFVKVLEEKGITLSLPNLKLLHSGGWKKLNSEKVQKEEFMKRTAKVFGTNMRNIIDFYGMVEQVGVVFVDCEYGHKHVPDFAEVIIRDINSLEEVEPGEQGIIEVMSILGSSYPSQAILTEDIGELVGIDSCKCGRKGKYFKFKSRVEKAETRGCGDTFAERENIK